MKLLQLLVPFTLFISINSQGQNTEVICVVDSVAKNYEFTVKEKDSLNIDFSTNGGEIKIENVLSEKKIKYDYSKNKFSYIAQHGDKRLITLIVSNIRTQNIKDTIFILPRPIVKDEYEKVNRDVNFGPIDKYVNIIVDSSRDTSDFNNRTNKTTHVTIYGITVTYDVGQKAYEYLKESSGTQNYIRQLDINCDTLIIKKPIILPQTTVKIYAKVLEFQDQGEQFSFINLTPLKRSGQTQVRDDFQFDITHKSRFDGNTGYNSGDLYLFINEIKGDSNKKRFVLKGGDGQNGGEGRQGPQGQCQPLVDKATIDRAKNLRVKKCPFGFNMVICDPSAPDPDYPGLIYISYQLKGHPEQGTEQSAEADYRNAMPRPGNGGVGTPAGKPGNGGNGGKLYSNISSLVTSHSLIIDSMCNIMGGDAGKPCPNKTKGGLAGTPNIWNIITYNGGTLYPEHGETQDGPDTDPLVADSIEGSKGKILDSASFWLQPLAAEAIMKRANEAYINENVNEANRLVNNLINDISKSETNLLDSNYEFANILREANVLKERLDRHVDYFGNPQGWVPFLSLEAMMQLFDNEVDQVLPLWCLAKKVQQKQKKYISLASELKDLIDKIDIDNRQIENTLRALPAEIDEIQLKQIEVANMIKAYSGMINSRLDQLKKESKRNVADRHKKSFWEEAAGVLSIVCSFIPIEQPILGKIGGAISSASNINFNDPLKALNEVANISGKFESTDFQNSLQNTKAILNKFVPDNPHNLINYAKKIQNVTEILNDSLTSYNRKVNGDNQAYAEEVQQELSSLKASDITYNSFADSLQDLFNQKTEFYIKLSNLTDEVNSLSSSLALNTSSQASFSNQLGKNILVNDPSTIFYINSIEEASKERLRKYHYYMAKAYEYRFLAPYNSTLNLGEQFDDILKLNSDSTKDIQDSDFLSVGKIYKEQLRAIVEEAVKEINKGYIVPGRQKFELDSLALSDLNNTEKGNSTSFNIDKYIEKLPREENRRLDSLTIESINYIGNLPNKVVTFNIDHLGNSLIRSGNKFFAFKETETEEGNSNSKFTWSSSQNLPLEEKPILSKPNLKYLNLLRTTLKLTNAGDEQLQQFFISPGLDNSIISITQPDNMPIKNLSIMAYYSYRTLELNPGERESIIQIQTEPNLPSFYELDQDNSQKSDGYSSFTRIYNLSHRTITIKADQEIGNFIFDKWLVNGLDKGSSVILTQPLSNFNKIIAFYKPK